MVRQNLLLNGGFDLFQRRGPGSASYASGVYGPDRWKLLTQTGQVSMSRGTNVVGGVARSEHWVSITTPSQQRFGLLQIVEGANVTGASQYATIRVENSAASSRTAHLTTIIWNGNVNDIPANIVRDWTSTDYSRGGFFIDDPRLFVQFVATGTVPAQDGVTLLAAPGGLSGLPCIVFAWVSDCQATDAVTFSRAALYTLEYGEEPPATPDDLPAWNARPLGEEIALCQRYYEKSYDLDTAPGTTTSSPFACDGAAGAEYSTAWRLSSPCIAYKVSKRKAVQPTIYSPYSGATGNLAAYTSAYVADRPTQTPDAKENGYYLMSSNGALAAGQNNRWHWTCDAEI
jgi:hypothetical protein